MFVSKTKPLISCAVTTRLFSHYAKSIFSHEAAHITLTYSTLILTPRLHYVPGGHGGHVSGHRGRNVVTVRQRRGTVSTNVSRRDCRGRRGKFLNSQKICHGNHGEDDLLFRT